MGNTIFRSKNAPVREGLSWDDRWLGPDEGLITCWEEGRKLRHDNPQLAEETKKGELPVLGWEGGVEQALKADSKRGSLNYLAEWQGLRGDDLTVDLGKKVVLTCSRTGVKVIYTPGLT